MHVRDFHAFVYIYAFAWLNACTYACALTCMYAGIPWRLQTTRSRQQVGIFLCIYKYFCVYMYISACMNIHVHVCTCMYKYICVCVYVVYM
jgi:hypothetical protein